MQINGTLAFIGQTQQVTDTFKKREIWVEISGQYPQTIGMQLTQDKCSLVDSLATGQEVKVDFDLQGKVFERKDGSGKVCITNLNVWKIEAVGNVAPQPTATAYVPSEVPIVNSNVEDDGLPF